MPVPVLAAVRFAGSPLPALLTSLLLIVPQPRPVLSRCRVVPVQGGLRERGRLRELRPRWQQCRLGLVRSLAL